ncbi:MAG: hypothetical protein IRZ00_07040 [Gemmatimonadetes bacterium]|nr:hypothetical protein [Gemmatimonadota bacterium]
MAIRDLLWACPLCGLEGGLHPRDAVDACSGCGARFRRGRGSEIVAELRDGRIERRLAADWAVRLARAPRQRGAGEWRRERVSVRFSTGEAPVYRAGELLGGVEKLGPPLPGELALTGEELALRLDSGEERRWPLDRLTAVQMSSGSLQIKARGEPLTTFRFPDGSARLWEESLTAALRARYRAAGRGEIVEFQPRIVTR